MGALDAQNALLEFIGTLPVDRHSNSGVLPLFEHTINLTKSVIDSQDSVVPTGDDKSEVDVTSCFQPSRKSRRGWLVTVYIRQATLVLCFLLSAFLEYF